MPAPGVFAGSVGEVKGRDMKALWFVAMAYLGIVGVWLAGSDAAALLMLILCGMALPSVCRWVGERI